MWIPRPPSALPRHEEGRERRGNLCRPLFVWEVSRSAQNWSSMVD